jgi:hypothetical protein
VALYAAGAVGALALGAVEHQLAVIGWAVTLVVYGPCVVALVLAVLLPVRLRPWPAFAALVMPILFGILVAFIMLFAGGGGLILLPAHAAVSAALIGGTLVLFDAAW